MALISLNSAPSGQETLWLDTVSGHEFEDRYRRAEAAGRERAEHRAAQNRLRSLATLQDAPPEVSTRPPIRPVREPRKRYKQELEAARAQIHGPKRRYRRGKG